MPHPRFVAAVLLAGCFGASLPAAGAPPSADRTIVADSGTRELSLPGGITLRLANGTRLTKLPPTELLLSAGGRATATHVLALESGSADVSFGPEAAAKPFAVMIKGPGSSLAVVKSGRARVLMRNRGLVVANLEGQTLVGTQQGIRTLRVGTIEDATRGNGNAQQIQILPAPAWQPGSRVALWVGDKVRQAEVEWTPVARASYYAVELLDAHGGVVRRLSINGTKATIGEPSLSGGAWDVRVRAVDEYDIDGVSSPTTKVVVASVILPHGAHVDERGRVGLAPGQMIRFSQASALEISHGDGFHWVGATGEYGLDGGEPHKLFVRSAGSSLGIPMHLVARDVRADVALGPARATWPSDPVHIRVHVKDSSGRLPSWVEAVAEVKIGLTPVPVAWQRSGDELVATLLPSAGKGPTVVRVEVRDQYGLPIGRGFLEVERARR